MGSLSIWHWLVVGAVALVLFGGKGKISDLMGDVAKGIKSFKKGLQEEDKVAEAAPAPAPEAAKTIDQTVAAQPAQPAPSQAQKAG